MKMSGTAQMSNFSRFTHVVSTALNDASFLAMWCTVRSLS